MGSSVERPTSHLVGRRCGGTTFLSSWPRRAAPAQIVGILTFKNCSPTIARRGIRFGQTGSLNHPIAGKQVAASVGDLSGPEPVAGRGPTSPEQVPYPPHPPPGGKSPLLGTGGLGRAISI